MADGATIEEIRIVSNENNAEILTKLSELSAISGAVSLIYNSIFGIVSSISELKDEITLLQGTVDAIDAKIIGMQSTQNTIIEAIKSVGDKEIMVDLQPILNAIADKKIDVDLQPVINAVENKTIVFDSSEIINAVNGSIDRINANTDTIKNSLSEELKNTNTSQISSEINSMNVKLDEIKNKAIAIDFEPVLSAIREKTIEVKREPVNVVVDSDKIVQGVSDIIVSNNISIAENLNEIKGGINNLTDAVNNNSGLEVEEYNY